MQKVAETQIVGTYDSECEKASVAINATMHRTIEDVIEIGSHLMKIRDMRPDQFGWWLSAQRARFRVTKGKEGFRLSYSTLHNYMNIALRFGGGRFKGHVNLSITKATELASPNFPVDRIQQEIDNFIFGVDDDLPPAMEEAVNAGLMGEKQARTVVDACKGVDPAIRRILDVQVISDPGVISLLQQVGEKAPDLLQEIVKTGAVQSGEESIPLSLANARDVKSALGEKRFNDHVEDWSNSRTILVQHMPVQLVDRTLTVVIPKDKEIPAGTHIYITVTAVKEE